MLTNPTVEVVVDPELHTPSKSIIDLEPAPAVDNIEVINANINRYESYRENCHKYYSAPIRKIKNVFDEKNDDLDLSHYVPITLRIQLALDVFNRDPPITHLKSISFEASPFDEKAAKPIGVLIGNCPKLEKLNLSQCRIGYEGLERIQRGLIATKSLVHIDLSHCNLNDECGKLIAIALTTNRHLKENLNHLNLSHNRLHVQSGKEIGKMLETNIGLKTLNLAWNLFYPEDDCIVPLMMGLTKNANLIKVDLSWNGLMGAILAKMLRKLFMKNEALTEIRLEYNRITGDDCAVLCRAFKNTKALKCIYLGGNPLTPTDIKQILTMIRTKNTLNILSFGESLRLSNECLDMAVKIMEKFPEFRIVYNDAVIMRPTKVVDFNAILIDRCRYLCMKPTNPKLKKDLGHFFWKVMEERPEYCTKEEFCELLLEFNKKLEDQFGEQMAVAWIKKAKKRSKVRKVALHEMAKFYLDRYPTEKPPPPPQKIARKSIRKSVIKKKL